MLTIKNLVTQEPTINSPLLGVNHAVVDFSNSIGVPVSFDVNSFNALLIIKPNDVAGHWSPQILLAGAHAAGIPYIVTDGVKYSRVRAWLDELEDEFDVISLAVMGPSGGESQKAHKRTRFVLKKLLEDHPRP